MKFTVKQIQGLQPQGKRYHITEDGGLTVRVSATGGRSWYYVYKHEGRVRWLQLGEYPSLSLKAARDRVAEAKAARARGTDPAAQKQAERHDRLVNPTVKRFAEEYIERHAKPHKKTWRADELMLERWIIPRVGGTKLADLRRRDVVDVLDAVRDAGLRRQPGKVLAVFRKLLRFAVERGVLESSPALYISEPQRDVNTTALSREEIRRWWAGTYDPEMGSPSARLALRLLLLTGQRGGEVAGMRIAELQLDGVDEDGDLAPPVWSLPSTRRKRKKNSGDPDHRVPLAPEALAVVQTALKTCADKKLGLVFPNRRGTGPIRVDGALHGTLRRIFDGASRQRTTHDARRTVATALGDDLGLAEETIARVLGHYRQTITALYIKRTERTARAALEAWERRLDLILARAGEDLV